MPRQKVKPRATISDVARAAGVSKVTVSNILNERETMVKISEETRQRVWAAVETLGYHPNALARALARKYTDTIAIVLQFPLVFTGWSGFTNELMHGASDKAIELGYDLMLHTRAPDSLQGEVQALTDGRTDGALLLRDMDDPLSDMLAEHGFPHVLFFTRSQREDVYWVDCDNVLGGRIATEHLIHLGHTRIAHLAGSEHSASAVDRCRGYYHTLHKYGLDTRYQQVLPLHHGGDDFTPLVRLLEQPDRPTALFAWADDVAIRAMKVCREMGLRVPEDVAVVGFDSTPICEHTDPPLTSVRQPIYEMAKEAMERLVGLIRGEPVEPRQVVYPPTLDIRASCGAQ